MSQKLFKKYWVSLPFVLAAGTSAMADESARMAWICEAQCVAVDFDSYRLAISGRAFGVSPSSRRRAFNRALGECQNKARVQGFAPSQAELVTRLTGERNARNLDSRAVSSSSYQKDAQAWSEYSSGSTGFFSMQFAKRAAGSYDTESGSASSESHLFENEYGLKVTYDVASPMDDRVCMQERIEDLAIPYTGSSDAQG